MSVVRAVALAVVALLLCCCGVPGNDVHRLDPATVPFNLLGTAPPAATPQAQGPSTRVYFVLHDRLAPVVRRVVGENVPAEAVRSLLVGPTPAEATAGLSSDVPAQTRLVSLDLSGSVATVDVSPEFGSVGGSDQVLAVAQIVFTLTASPYINSVRFALDGKVIEVPDASGSLSAAPRSRDDYRSVAPRS